MMTASTVLAPLGTTSDMPAAGTFPSAAPPAPTGTPAPTCRVVLDQAGLHVHKLTIADAGVLTAARRHLDQHLPAPRSGASHPPGAPTAPESDDTQEAALLAYVTAALSVGARALSVVASSLDTASLDRSVADLTAKVDASTERALGQLSTAVSAATDSEYGTIPKAVQASLDTLVTKVADLVAGEDAPVRATVTDSVRVVTEQALGEIQRSIGAQADAVRRVLATDAPGSPLHDLRTSLVSGLNESHRRLTGQLTELRTALEVDKATTAVAATAAARSPQHGLDFEAAALDALEHLVHTAGDFLEPTGTTPGVLPRCLKGDGVITLTPATGRPPVATVTGRIVVEVKDRDRAQSVTAWRTLLDEARTNRQATAALAILKSTDQMPGQRRLHALDASTYLIAYDPAVDDADLLTAVFHLLRAQAWHNAFADSGDTSEINLGQLKTAITDLAGALDGFDTLTRHSATARRSLDQLDKTATSLRADLRARAQATLDLLAPEHRTSTTETAA